ncbi:MAG TPA: ATP synthase F0 subunit B [Polyangiaceae bacterium]|nr:MAG: H(+)-transporting ATPase [Pseudomonadota bacterium]HLV65804.1 ATP synthase F0 subunit B [Polyangiaceae bacterium]
MTISIDPRLVAAGGVTLDFDNTVILQALLFTALLLILKPLLFDPVLRVFALREERTEGERQKARELQERAVELLERYERELGRVNEVATRERERLRAETAKLENEIMREAREATARIIEEGRRRIEAEVNAIRFDLGRESQRASDLIVQRVLGRQAN